MKNIEIGKNIQQIEGFKAFIPNPFPPRGGFDFSPEVLKKNNEATRLLGKLDGITKLLPDAKFSSLDMTKGDWALLN